MRKRVPSEWKTWVSENIARGVETEVLARTLVHNGFSEVDAAHLIRRTSKHPYTAAATNLANKLGSALLLTQALGELVRLSSLHEQSPGEPLVGHKIPPDYLSLFAAPTFAHFATIGSDGSPHITPVWIDYKKPHILVNSVVGRAKDKNIRRDPRVSIELIDPDNPYRYIMIKGNVAEIVLKGAAAHIDKLARKYYGVETYPFHRPDEIRCIYKIVVLKTYCNVSSL